jgi:PST family polysaccharide transporter
VVGVAAGYAVAAMLEWPLSLWWLSRVTEIPVRALLLGALRIIGCAALAGTVCFLTTRLTADWSTAAQLAAGLTAGLAAYGMTTLVPAVRSDLAGVVAWGRQMVGRSH